MAGPRIVYTQAGKVRVIIPSPFSKLSLAEIAVRALPADATDVHVVHSDDLPKQRELRNAWVQAGGVVSVDRQRAEKIVADRIRREREAEFAKTDAEYMAAVQRGDNAKAQAAAARAQKLRDAPAKDLSKLTLDELAAVTLGSLLE